jgi:hypothetical protein
MHQNVSIFILENHKPMEWFHTIDLLLDLAQVVIQFKICYFGHAHNCGFPIQNRLSLYNHVFFGQVFDCLVPVQWLESILLLLWFQMVNEFDLWRWFQGFVVIQVAFTFLQVLELFWLQCWFNLTTFSFFDGREQFLLNLPPHNS